MCATDNAPINVITEADPTVKHIPRSPNTALAKHLGTMTPDQLKQILIKGAHKTDNLGGPKKATT